MDIHVVEKDQPGKYKHMLLVRLEQHDLDDLKKGGKLSVEKLKIVLDL